MVKTTSAPGKDDFQDNHLLPVQHTADTLVLSITTLYEIQSIGPPGLRTALATFHIFWPLGTNTPYL